MEFQIESVKMQNYGQIKKFNCNRFAPINLIIGENGTGKTFLLKALYSGIRAMEDYKRGDDIRSIGDILTEKLRWTFQTEKIGDIVTRSSGEPLSFSMEVTGNRIRYQFSENAVNTIKKVEIEEGQKEGNSVFIPAKEVLSLFSVILKSREVDRAFGFDDTYYDLAKALRIAPSRGKNYTAFAEARKKVSGVIDGKVDYSAESGKWFYRNKDNQKFSIGATSEGVKKIAIMDRLFANGYLDKKSVIFIDELESALHPDAICDFLDMISMVADKMGIQVFITSHSYFVIKKLFLTALQKPGLVSCISLNKEKAPTVCNLSEGMPDNSIIQASIDLYEQEMDEVL